MADRSGETEAYPIRLKWTLVLTRLGLVAERLLRSFWPLWVWLCAGLTILFFGLLDLLQLEVLWLFLVLYGAVLLGAGIYGAMRFRWPSQSETRSRLDLTLAGRPLRALEDQPALGAQDPITRSIWQMHRERMLQTLSRAGAPHPDLRLAHLDPYGLRFVAMLGASLALVFGGAQHVGGLAGLGRGAIAPASAAASWEGWIEPPAYTAMPVLYLNDQPSGILRVPEGSQVTLRLYGKVGALTVQETVSARLGDLPSSAEAEQGFPLRQSGELAIVGPGGRDWQLDLITDHPPEVAIYETATTSARGEMALPFEARDDYDIIAGTAVISLDLAAVERRFGLLHPPENQSPVTLELPLPISAARDDFEEVLIEDFSDHVWAHLPITLRLEVEDAAGQLSAPVTEAMTLPARRFFDPMANALIELRRDLLWSRENAPRVGQLLRAISHRPEDALFAKETDYLRLRMILRRLETHMTHGLTAESRDEVAEQLWDLALAIEDGDLDDALARMQRAHERLSEAARNGASAAEIAQLMQELREATQDYMRQLAQQGRENQEADDDFESAEQDLLLLSQDDLQAMMDHIQDLLNQGRMAEAQQALQEFQEMMENMQMVQAGEGQPSPGQQAMNELGETLREQQGLSDEAFRQLQEQFNPGAQAGQSAENEGFSGGEGRGQSHDGTGQGRSQGEGQGENGQQAREGALSERQEALRQELDRQAQGLPGQNTEQGQAAREALDRAGEAMSEAEEAIEGNQLAEAIDRQADAMNALRDGMRNLDDAMNRRDRSEGEGSAQSGPSNLRDPLGRDLSGSGSGAQSEGGRFSQSDDVYRRARELLDEIRKRTGDTARPENERSYLRRLLDRF